MNKPLVIYHANCLDGFAAAYAAWLALGDDAEYLPASYGKEFSASYADRDVYILDFSFPLSTMQDIIKESNKLVWLDHHKTAFETWTGRYAKGDTYFESLGDTYILLNDNKCGAILAWGYFHTPYDIPALFSYVDDYDRWIFQFDATKAINKAMWSHAPWGFSQWRNLLRNPKLLGILEAQGDSILRAHNQQVESASYAAMPCLVAGAKGLAANAPPNLASDLGHMLAKKSGTFGMTWHMDKDKSIKVSLRSTGDYDVSALAKHYGGGGHMNAAGFTTTFSLMHNILIGEKKDV